MTIWPRKSTEKTGWGHSKYMPYLRELFTSPLNIHFRTSNLQHNSKRLKPSHVSLFQFLPTEILTGIGIWVSTLEHQYKFNPIVFFFNHV